MQVRHRTARHSAGSPLALVVAAFFVVACSDAGAPQLGAQTAPHAAQSTAPAGHQHNVKHGDGLDWQPAPAIFPAGAQMAVVQGDPSVAGAIFTVRLRLPNGYILPAHFHPTDEHVTVMSGTFLVGLGDVFSEKALLPPLGKGDFITAPANASHFAMARGLTVVQVHAMGPFQLTYVNPADDPTK
jgi:quercetin dioxygenase-like cupin family protein